MRGDWASRAGRRAQVAHRPGQGKRHRAGAPATFGGRNAKDLLAHFPAPSADDLDALLASAIETAVPEIEKRATGKKNTADYIALARESLRLVRGGTAAWADWVRLSKGSPEAGLKTIAQP